MHVLISFPVTKEKRKREKKIVYTVVNFESLFEYRSRAFSSLKKKKEEDKLKSFSNRRFNVYIDLAIVQADHENVLRFYRFSIVIAVSVPLCFTVEI